ncbi:MAG: hypothetical protein PHR28_12260 [candidate division Zixibacteria bacterium]|nr:hypothetical protein [candidate division Zixibacteria bacterium]
MFCPKSMIRRQIRGGVVLAVFIFLVLFQTPAIQAVGLNGRVSSDFYVTDENDTTHVRPFERLRADLLAWKGAGKESLTFHTYLRWTADWSKSTLRDPQTFVYDAYLKLTGMPKGTVIRLGRQFAYNSVGSALLDGVRLQYQGNRRFQVDMFGGSTVSASDPEKIQTPADFSVVGGRLSTQPVRSLRLGLNWIMRRMDGFTATHRVGLDAETEIDHVRLYGRAIYNVVGLRVGGLLMRASYAPPKWYLSGEFDWREPSVSANSIFSLIDFHRYKETRFEAQRKVWRRLAAVGQLHVGVFDSDDSWRIGVGMRADNFSVVWRHQKGYGGINDGFYGYANVPLGRRWECFATANAGRYRIQEEQVDRSDAYSGSLGLLWRPGHGWLARGEGQYLRNAVEKKDLRLLLRISKDFSFGDKTGIGML